VKTYILPDFTDFRPAFDLNLAKLYLANFISLNSVFASAIVQFWAPYRSAFFAEGGIF